MRALTVGLVVLGALGCIVEAPTSSRTEVKARPSEAPPQRLRVGANFGDQIELEAMTLTPGAAFPGDTVRVRMQLRVLAPIERDWMIFVHVEDTSGQTDRLNVDHAPRLGPTSGWAPGQTVVDEFDVYVPPQTSVRAFELALGFWDPRTDQRLPLVNKDSVKNDGRDRLFAATITVRRATP